MRALFATGTFLVILVSSTVGHSAVQCRGADHWCGPGRGCCPPNERCAPKSGCQGATRTGVKCGTGNCDPGEHCVFDRGGGRTPAARCEPN
jgi:hypothetical protein